MTLRPSDFRAFWRGVHHPDLPPDAEDGPGPFLWQQQLVDVICEAGCWPKVIDVPTGLGKTTALDIAVFTAAHAKANGRPSMPLRTFLVIDRRIIVDQAFEHASTIQRALDTAEPDSVVGHVAQALLPAPLERHDLDAAEDTPLRPLVVGRMRGGTTWAWRWLERPDQPAIIVGTVDQLGSRVLFDGYGVGDSLRPIDAALTGTDSLVLVDEAHLADAFITTMNDAVRIGAGSAPVTRNGPELVIMSATVREQPSGAEPSPSATKRPDRFQFDDVASMDEPVARQRLTAVKRLALAEAPIRKAHRVADSGAVLANAAWLLSEDHDVVGVVANTVAVARAVFAELQQRLGSDAHDRVVLITGRQREIDRHLLWDRWRGRIEAGRRRQEIPIFVVATQTIEVGADLDFSALVTESASIDAIVQRLGRLNRRGAWSDARALIVHPAKPEDDDPIYGTARENTWKWLSEQIEPQDLNARSRELDFEEVLDASPGAIDRLTRGTPQELRTDPVRVPVLFPHVLSRWVQTYPRPLDAPATGPFLHGIERDLPTASVLWREVRPKGEIGFDAVIEELAASVEVLPASPQEAVEVPIWAVQSWLVGDRLQAGEVSDLETGAEVEDDRRDPSPRPPVIVLDRNGKVTAFSGRIRPGTTIVAPTWLGGLDEFGWNPESDVRVVDIADLVEHRIDDPRTRFRPRRRTLRLDAAILEPFLDEEAHHTITSALADARSAVDEGADPRSAVTTMLKLLHEQTEPIGRGTGLAGERYLPALNDVVSSLLDLKRGPHVMIPPERDGVRPPAFLAHGPGAVEIWSTESTHVGTSISGVAVSLEEHQEAVAQRASTFADALGLTGEIRDAVVAAAAHHDLGKLDPRFQAMLNGGIGPSSVPLAKSGADPSKSWMFARSRQLSGYPRGMRHEAFSALAVADQFASHPERDLIVHLVAAHHGRARPLGQAVEDEDPINYEITSATGTTVVSSSAGPDWEQPRRFRELNSRFGVWGLALLEAIVRLSDIGCSAEGS